MSKKYYDFDGIYQAAKKENCSNIIVCGKKSNGKTYGALRKGIDLYLGLENPEYKGRIIRYARRLKETVKRDNLLNLFKMQMKYVSQVTDGQWNSYTMIGRRYYFCRRKGNKIEEKDLDFFCCVNALSTWETDSGADEGEAGIIVYDEALSREHPLKDEFDNLMKYRSNCMRDRTDYYCPVVLLGNTVTRDSELLKYFGVNLWKLTDEKQGQIQYIRNRKGTINAIFEWCGNEETQEDQAEYYRRFETDKTKMITDGVFETGQYKLMSLLQAEIHTEVILRICFIDKNFKLFADYRQYKSTGDIFILIHPAEHADGALLYINPALATCNGNVLNYFDNCAAETFRNLYALDNVLFDSTMTGEMYRSFAQKCIGLQTCIPD